MTCNRMRSIVLTCIALIAIVFAVYIQVGNHDFLDYDDNVYVTANPHVTSGITTNNVIWAFSSVDAANWHPVTWLSHMADVQIFGMNPHGHHLTNVVIHAVSAVLLLLLLFRITGSLWQSSFVAALFALHPLHVESVAWVAERKDVLSAFFWFFTLLLYSEYTKGRKPSFYMYTLFSFALGLMAKPMLVTLPVVMLLMDYWPLDRYLNAERGQGTGSQLLRVTSPLAGLVKEKIPFFLLSLLSGAVTIYAQHSGGAIASLDRIPPLSRIENALVAYVRYIGKALWPFDLGVLYPMPPSFPLWQVLGSLLVLLLISVATIRAGRRYPYLAAGWFWYLVTLVPVIGLIQVGAQSIADRYTYIPLTGLFIMVAWGTADMTKSWRYRKIVLALSAGMVIIASTVITWQQLAYWRDSVSLFRHALQVTADNSIMHNNLGFALFHKGHVDEAISEYKEALRIKPKSSSAHNNLGFALASQGKLDAAIWEYQLSLILKPDHAETHNNLGVALFRKGRVDEALREYQAALRIKPNDANAHNNSGLALVNKGAVDAAIQEYKEALRLKPDHSEVHNNLGVALANKGDLGAAIYEFQEALRTNPKDLNAQNNLGLALSRKKDGR